MRIHILQHIDFESEGFIDDWAMKKNYPITRTRLYEGELLPAISSIDWLVIMGGPMNIYEEIKYPFLIDEKLFIKKAVDQKKTVLGICLGAQLLADALGGKVTRNQEKEIGWFNVKLTDSGRKSGIFNGINHEFLAFHWHGDTFDIPPDAIHAAESEGCRNQAFIYQEKIIGLQFHLELNEVILKRLLKHCGNEIIERKYIQHPDEMLGKTERFRDINHLMEKLLNNLERIS